MKKIVAGLFVSLDGVAEAPNRRVFPYMTEIRFHEVVMDGAQPLRDADGRLVTRELMRKDW